MSISNAQRLNCKPRNFDSQRGAITGWAGADEERQAWAWAVWEWFMQQAKEHQKNLEEMPINMGGLRLTCQYLMWVLEDTAIDDRLLRQNTNTAKDEWLLWRNSTMAEFAKTLARMVERDRLEQGVPEIRKTLQKKVAKGGEGYLKSSEILLKMGGRANGEPPADTGIRPVIVDRYVRNKGVVEPKLASVGMPERDLVTPTTIEKRILSKPEEKKEASNESSPVQDGVEDPGERTQEVEGFGGEQDFA